jgi:hypothetical protein
VRFWQVPTLLLMDTYRVRCCGGDDYGNDDDKVRKILLILSDE